MATGPVVLLVDDQPLVLETIRAVLEALDYTVLTASSARAALDLSDRHGFDILMTDVRMPDMDGVELAAILAERYPNLPVLFISGFSDEPPGLGPRRAYLSKPCSLADIAATLSALLVPAGQPRAPA